MMFILNLPLLLDFTILKAVGEIASYRQRD
jgi:hypothetical protein